MVSSSRPYLLRAIYEWLLDNDLTPYIMVDADFHGVDVPDDFIEDHRIVLNVSPMAIRHLEITNEKLSFNARFNGTVHTISSPIQAVMAIYASENGRGMVFDQEDDETPFDGDENGASSGKKVSPSGAHLKVIK